MRLFNAFSLAMLLISASAAGAQSICDASSDPSEPKIRQRPLAGLCETQYGFDPETISDFFYTTSWKTNQDAVSTHGYAFNGVMAYLEGRPQPGTAPLYRFFSPSGHAHYYSTQQAIPAIHPYDWKAEGEEGYIYTTQVPGSRPLYRFVRTTPNLAYKLSWSSSSTGLPGFVRDGSLSTARLGYAFQDQPPAEVSSASSTRLLQRCKYGDSSFSCSGSNQAACLNRVRSGWIRNNSTSRPAGTNTHTLSLVFVSQDYFSADRTTAHFTAITRARIITQGTLCIDASNPTQQGFGVLVGRSGSVGCLGYPYPSVAIEAFWNGSNRVLPESCARVPLQNGVRYRLTVSTRDDGYIKYVLQDANTGATLKTYPGAGDQPNLIGMFPPGTYPANNSGHWIGSTDEVTYENFGVDVTNISSTWTYTPLGTPLP